MKKTTLTYTKKFFAIVLCLILSNIAFAQNVTVSGALAGNGSYPDLNSAFAAINGGAQTSATITVDLVGNTTETVSAVLNSGAWTSLMIQPSGGSARNITGAIAGHLIDLNGADNVMINGLNTGGNALSISNTNTGTVSTIRFINTASNNTITNCTVLGSSTDLTTGTILFSTVTAVGNSNNTISSCDIGPAGTNLPANGIVSIGTAANENANNTIQNCNIFDFFSATLISRGVFISSNSNSWTISGNKFYQTNLRSYTGANTHRAIHVAAGANYMVSNNTIGYSSSTGTGNYLMTASAAALFVGIELSVATTSLSTIQGNTITAITLTTTSSAATTNGALCGISVTSGNISINNNLIGGTSGVDLFKLIPTTSGGSAVGIHSSSTGTISISSNYLGGMSSSGATAAVAGGILGINNSGASGLLSITNNTIGNTTSNNMRAGTLGLTTGNSTFVGINLAGAAVGIASISGNILRNFASYSNGTGTGGTMRGIYTTSTGGTATYSITNNTLTDFVSNNANAAVGNGQLGNGGIIITNGVSNSIMYNTISGLTNTTTATTAVNVGGISTGVSSNPVIAFNKISNINNTGASTSLTAPTMVFGIFIRGSGGDCNIHNNMISLGDGLAANTSIAGITAFSGGGAPVLTRIYHNTINIMGAVTSGAANTACFLRGNFSASNTFAVDIRNNIFTNMRTGGTGSHYAIANALNSTAVNTGWGVNASNYNVLNTANPAALCYWTTAQTFASWKTASAGDAASYSGITVNYVNPVNDLHLNMGTTPTFIESGAQTISGLTNTLLAGGVLLDIDSQTRPGPAGSVNGGGFASDIGADEVDAAYLDAAPPTITHTVLPGTCSTSDRTLSANILDFSGTNTGTLTPRIYYNKNGGSYVNAGGVLASGTPSNGTWNFTISSTALSGLTFSDVINYYFIAQDGAPVNNVISSPSVGLVASDVNNVTTPPSTTYSYVIATMSGTYNVGSTGTYTSLTSAANAYNTSCLSGPVTFVLTDAVYSTAETYPIVFQNNVYASSTNSLLIVPASGTAVTLSPTLTTINSIIKFLNAKHITIDGLNTSGSSLTAINSNSSSVSANFWLASNAGLPNPGNSNITLKNITAIGGSTTQTNGLIGSVDGAAPSGTGGQDNDNIRIHNNVFLQHYNGMLAVGSASSSAGGMDNWEIIGNTFGPAASASTNLGGSGIILAGALNFTIANNIIQNIRTTGSSIYGINLNTFCNGFSINQNTITNIYSSAASSGLTALSGIFMGNFVVNGSVSRNNIMTAVNTHTNGYASRGIMLNTATAISNIEIKNNFISDIVGSSDPTAIYWPIGIALEGTTGGVNIDFNTINLSSVYAGKNSAGCSACLYQNSNGGNLNIRNNLFTNTYDNTASTTDIVYCIYSAANATAINVMNNNNYFVGGLTTNKILGYVGATNRNTLTDVQVGFGLGKNLNSINFPAQFTSATDLHLTPTIVSNSAFDNSAFNIPSITDDIDGQVRNNTTPDIGADEFTSTGTCTSAIGGTITPASYSVCSTSSLLINTTNPSAGLGTTYNWQISSTAGGTYTDIAVTTGSNLTFYNSFPTGVYYMVLKSSCPNGALTGVSNEATVSVVGAPSPTITASSSTLCTGSSVTLTASGASTYSWNTTSTASSIVVAPTSNTVYTLFGITSAPCANVSTTVGITAFITPTITASSASTFVCLNANQATLSATGANTYTWTDGTNNFVGGNVNPTPTISATYSVIGTSTNGCNSAEVTQSISVNAPAVSISGNIAICPGETTTLTATGTSLTYSWSTGATTSSITSTPASNTVYIVTGTDGQGCQRTFSQAISVGNVSVSITGPSTVCTGNQINLTANGATSYTWDTGAQASTIAPSPTITTTYSVIGVSGNCSNTAVTTITVNPFPVLTVSGNSVICAGETTTLSVSGASTYSWSTSSTATAINVSPATNTVYSVDGNSLGCITNATFAVTSNSLPIVTVAQSATAVCVSSPVSFTASGANTYSWSGGPGTDTFVANPTSASIYTVTGTTAQNCSATRTVGVGSFSLPVMAIAPASATTCLGNSVTFTASGASTYTWNASPTETASTFSNTPTATITHTVVGTTAQGCVGNATVALVANPIPTLSIAPASITLCVQSPATFTASGADTYTWNSVSQGSTANFFHLNSTTHTVVGTNSLGCSSNATVGVTALALPVVSIAPSLTTVCVNSTANFTASGALTYTWYNASTNSVIAITPTTTGSYSVVGTDANGCSSSGSAVLLTNPLPVVSTSINTSSVCPSRSVSLSASGASTYSWITLGVGATLVTTPTISTTYTVIGTTSLGCSSSTNVSVFVFALPSLSVTPASPTLCLNQTTTLTASGANSYTWSNATSGNTLEVTSLSNETFTLTGINAQGCVNTKTVPVVVNQLPTLTVLPGLSNVICAGESMTLTVSGTATFTWMPGNMTTSTLEVSPTSPTFYTVAGTDANNCKNQTVITLAVNPCTGINEVSGNSASLINVYPNPSNGSFNIEAYSKTQVVVYNLLGAVVYENEVLEGTTKVNIQNNAKGVYYMKVSVGKQNHTYKLIVE